MRKMFVLIAAATLSLAAASAQDASSAPKTTASPLGNVSLAPGSSMHKAPAARIRMDDGEHLMGFYTTDDLPPHYSYGYLKLGFNGSHPVGALFDEEVIGDFTGGEIVRFRFALACDAHVSNAFIYEATEDCQVAGEPVATVGLDMTLGEGWNDVELPEPVTIKEGTCYLIGFEYTEDDTGYPLLPDGDIETDHTSGYGILAYGDFGSGTMWNSYTGYGELCIQAVVRGGNFTDYDIGLDGLSIDSYCLWGQPTDYSLQIRNQGNYVPESYTLGVEVDGEPFEVLESPIDLTMSFQTLECTLGDALEVGSHTLRVYVADVNGKAPAGNLDDDVVEARFSVYDGKVDRQMNLIENFTSIGCTYCPRGHAVLERMQEDNPGKYACVIMHFNYGVTDPFYVSEADYVAEFADCESYPTACFNRYMVTDSGLDASNSMALAVSYDWPYTALAASMFDEMVDRYNEDNPAMVPVDIETSYDCGTRQLDIRVSGTGVGDARTFLDGCRLTVYITEDNLVYTQYNEGVWIEDYVHNDILRAVPCDYPWGNEIAWTSDRSYENDFTITLDEEWDWENIKVVAFVSGPMAVQQNGEWVWGDRDAGAVNNANMASISSGSVGIATVQAGGGSAEASRYAIDGRRLQGPVKGINIVRMPDGSTRKVVVR